jgi:hypothetical protein
MTRARAMPPLKVVKAHVITKRDIVGAGEKTSMAGARCILRTWVVVAVALATMFPPPVQSAEDDVIPYSQLVIVHGVTPNISHTSLDGAPDVPDQGVRVSLTCVIRDNALVNCVPDEHMTAVENAFISTALKRVRSIEVGPATRSGDSAAGRRSLVVVTIKPTDRFKGSSIDFSDGDLLSYDCRPSARDIERLYPRQAIYGDVEALVDLACQVNATLSFDCPDIRVELLSASARGDADDMKALFTDAAQHVMSLYRVAPRLANGKAAVGSGVRQRIRFVLM